MFFQCYKYNDFLNYQSVTDMLLASEHPVIRNLKIGVNINLRESKHLLINNHCIVNYSNYSVLRDIFVYIIFWSGNYVNITKIRKECDIAKAVKHFKTLIKCDSETKTTIHNICASGIFKKKHNLKLLHGYMKENENNARVKFNQNVFPALYVKYSNGTCIIFQNGKYTIVGCKSRKQVFDITETICVHMNALL